MSDDLDGYIVCPNCDGSEGWFDTETSVWIECANCGGEGGWYEASDDVADHERTRETR